MREIVQDVWETTLTLSGYIADSASHLKDHGKVILESTTTSICNGIKSGATTCLGTVGEMWDAGKATLRLQQAQNLMPRKKVPEGKRCRKKVPVVNILLDNLRNLI